MNFTWEDCSQKINTLNSIIQNLDEIEKLLDVNVDTITTETKKEIDHHLRSIEFSKSQYPDNLLDKRMNNFRAAMVKSMIDGLQMTSYSEMKKFVKKLKLHLCIEVISKQLQLYTVVFCHQCYLSLH